MIIYQYPFTTGNIYTGIISLGNVIKRQIIPISRQTNLSVAESWFFSLPPVERSELKTSTASCSGAAVDDEGASIDGAAEDAAAARDGGILEAT